MRVAEEAYRVLHGEYLSDVAAAVARDADGVAASGPQADGDTPRLRKQAIHLRTAEAIVVSEGDVQEFFSDYGTCRVEWLNAFSLNVVFEDEASANRAFDSMSEQVPTVRDYPNVSPLWHVALRPLKKVRDDDYGPAGSEANLFMRVATSADTTEGAIERAKRAKRPGAAFATKSFKPRKESSVSGGRGFSFGGSAATGSQKAPKQGWGAVKSAPAADTQPGKWGQRTASKVSTTDFGKTSGGGGATSSSTSTSDRGSKWGTSSPQTSKWRPTSSGSTATAPRANPGKWGQSASRSITAADFRKKQGHSSSTVTASSDSGSKWSSAAGTRAPSSRKWGPSSSGRATASGSDSTDGARTTTSGGGASKWGTKHDKKETAALPSSAAAPATDVATDNPAPSTADVPAAVGMGPPTAPSDN